MSGFDEVRARLEIEKTLCRYAWSFDFDFAKGGGACFTEDVVGDFGANVVNGRDEMAAELERRRRDNYAADELTLHVITNSWLRDITPEEIHVTSYCTFYVKQMGVHEWQHRSTGYYDDTFVPVGDTWLIRKRTWMFGARL